MNLARMIFQPNIFLWLITALFAANAISSLCVRDWRMAWYCLGAVILQLSIVMGK